MNSVKLLPQLDVGPLHSFLVRRMTVVLAERGVDEGVLVLRLVHGLSVERANLPAGHVGHQFGLLVPVPADLLQVFAIPFGEQQRHQRELGRTHLDLVTLHLLVVQVEQVQGPGRDGQVNAPQGLPCKTPP